MSDSPQNSCLLFITIQEQPQEEAALICAEFLAFCCFAWGECPSQRRPLLPFITLPPAFTVELRAPQANWTTHKASHNCCPPPLWVLSEGALYQVLNAAAEAVNATVAGGGGVEAGVLIISGESGYVLGGGGWGVPLSNLTRIPEQSVFRGRALCFFPPLRVSEAGQDPPTSPPTSSFKVSSPLTHHAAPPLILLASTTGFLTPTLLLIPPWL